METKNNEKLRRTITKMSGFRYLEGDILTAEGSLISYWVVQKITPSGYYIEGFSNLEKIVVRSNVDKDTLINTPGMYSVSKEYCEELTKLYQESNKYG